MRLGEYPPVDHGEVESGGPIVGVAFWGDSVVTAVNQPGTFAS